MSTEVTPDLLRRVADAWEGGTASDDYARHELRARADDLERESQPLPTEPGWYPNIVVEWCGDSCTGALLTDEYEWRTHKRLGGSIAFYAGEKGNTIRWAEQDGTTPGQTLWEAGPGKSAWRVMTPLMKDGQERIANAVLAAHGTPTLTPVGEHPEPGTRGLLPVTRDSGGWWETPDGWVISCCASILADPRPGGAHA